MTRITLLRALAAWCVTLLLLTAAAEENPPPVAINGEPVTYDAEFEAVSPPTISYEDFAGPDPVLEGTPRPASPPSTAGEQRLLELQQATADTPPGAADSAPPEFGTRSVAEVVTALCIVLALIVLLLMLVRRFGGRTPFLAGVNLGQVLGRVYLTPKASLHFVRTGGKVLVVGVTQDSVQLVETFDAEAFQHLPAQADSTEPSQESGGAMTKGSAFLAQLREQTNRMRQPAESEPAHDGDIATLRGDIERLQRMLREATRE